MSPKATSTVKKSKFKEYDPLQHTPRGEKKGIEGMIIVNRIRLLIWVQRADSSSLVQALSEGGSESTIIISKLHEEWNGGDGKSRGWWNNVLLHYLNKYVHFYKLRDAVLQQRCLKEKRKRTGK